MAAEYKRPRLNAGIDVSLYKTYSSDVNIRAELGLPNDCPLVAAATMSSAPQDPAMFVAIAQTVLREIPSVQFVWLGTASSRREVAVGASLAGIEANMHDLPYTPDLRCVLSQLSVFVVTAAAATFGYVTCEAMALGIPVVAACDADCEEVVWPGRTGYLVPPGEVELFSMALRLLLNDPDLRSRLGRASRKRAIEQFDLSRITPELEELYLSLLDQR